VLGKGGKERLGMRVGGQERKKKEVTLELIEGKDGNQSPFAEGGGKRIESWFPLGKKKRAFFLKTVSTPWEERKTDGGLVAI